MKKIFLSLFILGFIIPIFSYAQSVAPTTFYINDTSQGSVNWGSLGDDARIALYNPAGDIVSASYRSDNLIDEWYLFGSNECYNINSLCLFNFSIDGGETPPYLEAGNYTIVFITTGKYAQGTLELERLDVGYYSEQAITLAETGGAFGFNFPANSASDLALISTSVISGIWQFLATILAIILAFYIIQKIIQINGRGKDNENFNP